MARCLVRCVRTGELRLAARAVALAFAVGCCSVADCFLQSWAPAGSPCFARMAQLSTVSVGRGKQFGLAPARPNFEMVIKHAKRRLDPFVLSATTSAQATHSDSATPESTTKSALILSWFYAQPKEIELVKRIYKKRGFSDVVVVESLVKSAATPRGWYKSYLRYVKGSPGQAREAAPLNLELGRRFDVVHCMSGGFLNLYLLLSAKVPIQFDTLVMDSTPILPQPRAFVRFARAYMNENGMKIIPTIVPEPLHTLFYTVRWSMGALYVRLKHKWFVSGELAGKDPEVAEPADRWAREAANDSFLNRYIKMSGEAVDTVFNRPGLRAVFLYNPGDPFINPKDIEWVMAKCKDYGVHTTAVINDQQHIQTIFRKPKVLFDALAALPSAAQ